MGHVRSVIVGGFLVVILAYALMGLVKQIWPALVVLAVLYGVYALMFKRPL